MDWQEYEDAIFEKLREQFPETDLLKDVRIEELLKPNKQHVFINFLDEDSRLRLPTEVDQGGAGEPRYVMRFRGT